MTIRRHTLKPNLMGMRNPRKMTRDDAVVIRKNKVDADQLHKDKMALLRQQLIERGIIKPASN